MTKRSSGKKSQPKELELEAALARYETAQEALPTEREKASRRREMHRLLLQGAADLCRALAFFADRDDDKTAAALLGLTEAAQLAWVGSRVRLGTPVIHANVVKALESAVRRVRFAASGQNTAPTTRAKLVGALRQSLAMSLSGVPGAQPDEATALAPVLPGDSIASLIAYSAEAVGAGKWFPIPADDASVIALESALTRTLRKARRSGSGAMQAAEVLVVAYAKALGIPGARGLFDAQVKAQRRRDWRTPPGG